MGLKAIKLLSKTIITLLMLTVGTVVSAGSVWDGSVSVARYGYLPQTGMYAASNAFPQNTRVTVTNPHTGKSVDVVILERLEDNNLFLVLSSDAAESVGIEYGDIFHGTISEQVATGPGTEDDIPYNPDPDVNPSALSGGYSELALIQEYIDNELGGVDESLIIPDTEIEPEVPDVSSEEEPLDSVSDDTAVPDDLVSSVPELVEGEPLEDELAEVELAEVEDIPAGNEIIAESKNEEPIEEVIEDTTDPVSVPDDSVPDSPVPELAEGVEVVEDIEDEPDIPLVENMPMEEVYNYEPDKSLPIPDMVEIAPEIMVTELVEEDIPLVINMSTSVPSVRVVLADLSENIPELPVPEEDTPVITSMSMEILKEDVKKITISELPELPIIELEEVLSDEKPVAVTMTADVVVIEEVEDISPILPEVVVIEEESELPSVEEFITREPDMESEIVIAAIEPEIEAPVEEPVEEIVTFDKIDESDELLMDVEVILEPSDLRPPPVVEIVVIDDVIVEDKTVVEETEEIVTVPELVEGVKELERVEDERPAASTYNMTRVLAEDSYYLQLGAYREQYSALDLADSLGGMYPVTVFISDSMDTLNYKVMVGPLGQDESGAVLYSFKSSGYPDAFLRKGL